MPKSHGKIIWVGEHACVYGRPAIVSSIPLTIEDENLPRGVGLGYSSAYLLSVFRKCGGDPAKELEFVNAIERELNSHFSGVDSFMCLNDGVYKWKDGASKELPEIFFPYFIVNTGCEESTKEMTDMVAASGRDGLFDAIGVASDTFQEGLLAADIGMIESAIRDADSALRELGVVDSVASALIDQLSSLGLSCKITGAGGIKCGSGCVLGVGVLPDDIKSDLDVVYEFIPS